MKYTLILTLCLVFCQINAQNKDVGIRDLFSSVVHLSDLIPEKKVIKNKEYEILIKNQKNGKTQARKTFKAGTGFFIYKNLDIYLVTAAHVAKDLSINAKLKYQSSKGIKREVTMDKLLEPNTKQIPWVLHPKADVAVLHIPLKIFDTDFYKKLNLGAIGYSGIIEKLEVPDRLQEITVFGFPLGLGISYKSIAPITKNLRPASDIIYLRRFDNKVVNPFFLLDDPSISGFSGGPVMRVISIDRTMAFRPGISMQPTITGLVHGTINGKAGGFAAIVPGIQILETINLAPSYNGKYIFYYPNGSIWSEVIYKNGIPWNVISNFGPDGKPQDKGTLKNGNGELYIYNEDGKQEWTFIFKNGRYLGNVAIMTKSEKAKFNKLIAK